VIKNQGVVSETRRRVKLKDLGVLNTLAKANIRLVVMYHILSLYLL